MKIYLLRQHSKPFGGAEAIFRDSLASWSAKESNTK